MSNWFAGIYQSGSGLDAARYGLSVVSQNMANAANPGYTRQTAQLAAVDMSPVSGIMTGHGAMGGVAISGTSRNTDMVLDSRVRNEGAKSALADTAASQLRGIEGVLGEPSETGLATQLDDFWNSWGTLATNPSSSSARSLVISSASTVAATLNSMSSSLHDTADSTTQALAAEVDSVNSVAAQLADLNGQITVGTATGANVNSLLDSRDTLLASLSSLAGVTATIEPSGAATVTLGGQTLVSGVASTAVSVDSSYALSVGGTAVVAGSGSIAARVSTLTDSLPAYRTALDSVATTLANTVNTAQTGGFDINGNPGTAMFAGSGAGDLQVVLTDPDAVSAAGVPGGGRDNSVATALSQAGAQAGSVDSLFAALVGRVAAASATAAQRAETQGSVQSYVTNLKTSMSGVSFDEEAANMLALQQAFNASSRVLTAIDSMLDTLINHTGVVGRG